MKWISIKDQLPKKDGRYFLLVDMDTPHISNGEIVRKQMPMVGNYRAEDGGWVGVYPFMEITHWVEVPELDSPMSEDSEEKNPYFRYQHDNWYFAVYLSSGDLLIIQSIDHVYDDYIKVTLHHRNDIHEICLIRNLDITKCIGSLCSRRSAIINKAHILMILEIADT